MTYLDIKPNAPKSAVSMPHCKLERQTLGDEELEVKDVGGLELGYPCNVVFNPYPGVACFGSEV